MPKQKYQKGHRITSAKVLFHRLNNGQACYYQRECLEAGRLIYWSYARLIRGVYRGQFFSVEQKVEETK